MVYFCYLCGHPVSITARCFLRWVHMWVLPERCTRHLNSVHHMVPSNRSWLSDTRRRLCDEIHPNPKTPLNHCKIIMATGSPPRLVQGRFWQNINRQKKNLSEYKQTRIQKCPICRWRSKTAQQRIGMSNLFRLI